MSRLLALTVTACALWIGAGRAVAQDAVLSQTYGAGVHAFFDGDYQKAVTLFTKAINAGSTDPRCYYYRGLTFLKNGRKREAQQDFAKGAALEMGTADRVYDVSLALERIQGPMRQQLEVYRAEARMAAHQRRLEEQRQRYGELRQAESRILLQQATPGATVATPPVASIPQATAPTPGLFDPFAEPSVPPATSTVAGPGPASAEPMEDPFAGPPTTAPVAIAPGVAPAAPSTPPLAGVQPVEDPAAVLGALGDALGLGGLIPSGGADPFGDDPFGDTPIGDDPFGDTPFGSTPGGADPFGSAPGGAAPFGSEDPFGGGADPFAPPPAGGPSDVDPFGDAPTGTDPFGGAPGSADPFDANPFGGADPFGGGADPFGGGADPFGGADSDADPFFGTGSALGEEEDPFAADPF